MDLLVQTIYELLRESLDINNRHKLIIAPPSAIYITSHCNFSMGSVYINKNFTVVINGGYSGKSEFRSVMLNAADPDFTATFISTIQNVWDY